jgi:alkanesulfonate monooxygenase SsuD/methylene tetrahydromethanopterin reductase-like flavin-dependent oxidoreductase (luciferase family)
VRFGLSTSPQHTTWEWLLDVWQRADRHDVFESAWTFDHLYPLGADIDAPCLEGWTTLTALMLSTRRLRGGVLVSSVPFRPPALVAKMAATLDVITNGRVELGLGAGWYELESASLGLGFEPVKERFDRLEEAIEIVTGLLAGDVIDHGGTYYELDQARCRPLPEQRPIPLCLGGRGGPRTLALVARHAQHWNYSGTDPDEFRRGKEQLARLCSEIGRDPAAITCSTELRSVEPATVRRDIDRFGAAGLDLALIELDKSLPPEQVDRLAAQLS